MVDEANVERTLKELFLDKMVGKITNVERENMSTILPKCKLLQVKFLKEIINVTLFGLNLD